VLAVGPIAHCQHQHQSKETSAYSLAVDERMSYLKNNAGKKNTVLTLKPLPPSGMLYSAEINATQIILRITVEGIPGVKAPVRIGVDH
jgi:hypothetical protein